jgi:hypothetical protein
MVGADFTIGKASARIDQFSRFLWVKNRRNINARQAGGSQDPTRAIDS